MIRRILLLCCYCGFGIATLLSAEHPDIQFDVAAFRGRSGLVSIDIYIQFNRAQLKYTLGKDGRSTELAAVALVKQAGQIITFDQLDVIDRLGRNAIISGNFTRHITFDLTPGNYDLELAVTDGLGGEFDSTIQLPIIGYKAQQTGISDLVLATTVHPRMSTKLLQRRGLNIYPIADGTVGDTEGMLWYFVELYGLTPEDTIVVHTAITDTSGIEFAASEISVLAADLVYPHWGALNPSGLKPGAYDLSVTGWIGADSLQAVHSFTVLAADSTVVQSDSLAADWDKLSRRKLERIVTLMGGTIDHVRFVALDSLAQMNELASQVGAFITQLPDTSTAAMAGWLERWELIRNSDPGYRYTGRLSPAGEMVLLYGLPSLISRHGATSTQWGYQTWQYGAVEDSNFVVLLELDRGELTMLTGTLPGLEMRTDWQTAVQRATDLSTYFAPAVMIVDSTAIEEVQETDAAVELEVAPAPPVVESTAPVPAATEVLEAVEVSPAVDPADELDENEIEAPIGTADTTIIDTTLDQN